MRPTASSPIGVYDSGVGGVSILRALRAALPEESFIYVADSGHAPYGGRSQQFLLGRAREVVGFLAHQGVKAVVLACNTVSVATSTALRAEHDFPIVAMEPAIKPATAATKSGTVLVLATEYTTRSESVERLCRQFGADVRVILQACPGLVEQVERGELSSPRTLELLNTYLQPGLAAGADTVVLGCTHYAFLQEQIVSLSGSGISIIEPSEAIARQLCVRLAPLGRTSGHGGPVDFYTSGSLEQLHAFLAMIDEKPAHVRSLLSAR